MVNFALISRLRAAASPEGEAKEKAPPRGNCRAGALYYSFISRTY